MPTAMAAPIERRIWVKRPGASPTQIRICEGDLVDDIRDVILRKYANSLSRYDSPDLTIRIFAPARNGKPGYQSALGPAEDICAILDASFPHGQTVNDALVVETPDDAKSSLRPVPAVALPTPEIRKERRRQIIPLVDGTARSPSARPRMPDLEEGKESSDDVTQAQQPAPRPVKHISPRIRPKKIPSPKPVPQPAITPESPVPAINVLLVDDNNISLKFLAKKMERWKLRYETASDGQIAIEKWQKGGFHLILMDIQMPNVDGLEATKDIRLSEKMNGCKTPVIIVALTAGSTESDRREALAAGCNDFVTKPVDPVWLERKMREWGCMQALVHFDGWRGWKDGSAGVKGGQQAIAA